jgi:hypothetical protein
VLPARAGAPYVTQQVSNVSPAEHTATTISSANASEHFFGTGGDDSFFDPQVPAVSDDAIAAALKLAQAQKVDIGSDMEFEDTPVGTSPLGVASAEPIQT